MSKSELYRSIAYFIDYQNQLCNFLENNLTEFRYRFYDRKVDIRNIINSRPLTEDERFKLYQEIQQTQSIINTLKNIKNGNLD